MMIQRKLLDKDTHALTDIRILRSSIPSNIGESILNKNRSILIALFFILLIPGVNAQNTHNLEWVLVEDQEIRYQVTQRLESYLNVTTSEYKRIFIVIISINDLPEIPNSVVSLNDIPYADLSVKYENGTAYNDALIPIPIYTPLLLPIGNWSLLNDIYTDSLESMIPDISITDSVEEWSYTYLINEYDSGSEIEIRYSKSLGLLTCLRVILVLEDMGEIEWILERVDSIDLLAIGVVSSAIGLSLVAILVIWKRKHVITT